MITQLDESSLNLNNRRYNSMHTANFALEFESRVIFSLCFVQKSLLSRAEVCISGAQKQQVCPTTLKLATHKFEHKCHVSNLTNTKKMKAELPSQTALNPCPLTAQSDSSHRVSLEPELTMGEGSWNPVNLKTNGQKDNNGQKKKKIQSTARLGARSGMKPISIRPAVPPGIKG